MTLYFVKTILNITKFDNLLRQKSYGVYYKSLIQHQNNLSIEFDQSLDQASIDDLSLFVSSFVDYETVDQMQIFLDESVFPFIKKLINTFSSENISMGITQAGKSSDLIGLFENRYLIPNVSRPFSIKSTFDTGSLYSSLQILSYLRLNTNEWIDLDPFITDQRILKLINEIESFLGIQLSQ